MDDPDYLLSLLLSVIRSEDDRNSQGLDCLLSHLCDQVTERQRGEIVGTRFPNCFESLQRHNLYYRTMADFFLAFKEFMKNIKIGIFCEE